jgi:small subunit ribosomal protein S1
LCGRWREFQPRFASSFRGICVSSTIGCRTIPEKYIAGQIVCGKVTKLTNFGVFIELEPDMEGLLHVSELSDDKVNSPQEIIKAGEDVEVKILRVDIEDRKIGLSLKQAKWASEVTPDGQPGKPQRGGLDSSIDIGTDLIDPRMLTKSKPAESIPDEAADNAASPSADAQ